MIKFDRSWNSILVLCTECPYWHALRFDQAEAYLSGEAHQVRVHDVNPHDAASPRRLWEKRHAAATEKRPGFPEHQDRGSSRLAGPAYRFSDS